MMKRTAGLLLLLALAAGALPVAARMSALRSAEGDASMLQLSDDAAAPSAAAEQAIEAARRRVEYEEGKDSVKAEAERIVGKADPDSGGESDVEGWDPSKAIDGTDGMVLDASLKNSLSDVSSGISEVKKMIKETAEMIARQRLAKQKGVAAARDRNSAAAAAAAKAEAKRKAEEDRLALWTRRRRRQVDRCLTLIRGGADRLYFKLKELFAQTKVTELCPTLKAFEFPNLVRHGFHERMHTRPTPDREGGEVLFFTVAKKEIFQCMCEHQASNAYQGLPPHAL